MTDSRLVGPVVGKTVQIINARTGKPYRCSGCRDKRPADAMHVLKVTGEDEDFVYFECRYCGEELVFSAFAPIKLKPVGRNQTCKKLPCKA